MEGGKAAKVKWGGFGKKARLLAGAGLTAVSMAGMAVFYVQEEKVSSGYREAVEAAVQAYGPELPDSLGQVPGQAAGEVSQIPDGGKGEPEGAVRLPGREGTAEEAGEKKGEAVESHEWDRAYDWDALLSINEDTLGWLYLPGSLIDFPVVGAKDNGFYLSHGFDRQESSAGCLFMDKDTGMEDFNRVVYGHNMGTGSKAMFSTLLSFKEEEYFNRNPVFYFTELSGRTEMYEVMAVVKYDVKDVGEWDFRTREHGTMEEYNRWFEQLEERAFYYREPEKAPERILTLSTCDRSRFGRDGRLLVIAAGKGGGCE